MAGAGWWLGRSRGLILAGAAASAWLLSEIAAPHEYPLFGQRLERLHALAGDDLLQRVGQRLPDDADELLRDADAAMYGAKQQGKGRIAWLGPPPADH